MGGLFITFEGGEGTGKSTQIKRLSARLADRGVAHIVTREPGGTPQGEALRALLLNGAVDDWTPQSEALLNYAARVEHIRTRIAPALESGEAVLCDRFMDSTMTYQGHAGGCDIALIQRLETVLVGNYRPHLTLIFDLDPQIGLARAKERGGAEEMRFEQKGLAFHRKIREGFQTVARKHPARCKIIDANGTVDDVEKRVWLLAGPLFHGS